MSGIFTKMGMPTNIITQEIFNTIKNELSTLLTSNNYENYWTCGSSGMFDENYPYQINHNKKVNDIDVFVNCIDKKKLELLLLENNYDLLQTGNIIHILYKYYYQIDLICIENSYDAYKHHIHDYNSNYSGSTKVKLLSDMINNIDGFEKKYFQYYAIGGELRIRELGIVLTRDIDEVARYIFENENVNGYDLRNVESIMEVSNNKKYILKMLDKYK